MPAGVPAVTAAVEPVKVAAETPEADEVNSFVPLPEVASASVPAPWLCVPSAEPVKVGTLAGQEIAPSENAPPEFVPAGVPPLTADVTCDAVPVKVGAATEPVRTACVPVKLGAETVPAGV